MKKTASPASEGVHHATVETRWCMAWPEASGIQKVDLASCSDWPRDVSHTAASQDKVRQNRDVHLHQLFCTHSR
jgi:hypothetical protein